MKKLLGFIAGLFLIVGLTQSGYATDSASTIYSKTQANLTQAEEEMGHTIGQRIDKIKIGIDETTFISFGLSDTFPDNFTDGQIVGFVDVSEFEELIS